MKETWKPVVGWEGDYEVSSRGMVRDRKGRIQAQTLVKGGYLNCYLHHNMRRNWPRVHILVAEAFIPNPDGLPCVEHIDGDHRNNTVENLRWTYYLSQEALGDDTNTDEYRPVKSVEGLSVNRQGQFIYRGRKKAVRAGHQTNGLPASVRIEIVRNGRKVSLQAAKLVAEAWLWRYAEGDYITYKDGNCQNICADNLELADAEEYTEYLLRNSGYEADDIEERKRKLQLVIDEAGMTLHYFKTLDFTPIHKHVEEYLYPTLMEWSIKTLGYGEYKSMELAGDAIARMYEVLAAGMCLYNYERFLKKLMHNYKKKGTFGFTGAIPKPIRIIVEQLKLDCLWERYKVTSKSKK